MSAESGAAADAESRYYRDVDALIARVARRRYGAARTGAPAPLPLIRAAADVEASGRAAKTDAVRAARGAGETWDAIGEALELTADAGHPRAEAAYEEIVGRRYAFLPNLPPPMLHWTCTTCHRRVEESGPPGSDPSMAEQGHTDDCGRHRTEVADYASGLAR